MKRYSNGGTNDQVITHGVPVDKAIPMSLIARYPSMGGEKMVVTFDLDADDVTSGSTVLHLGQESVGLTRDQTEALCQLLSDLLDGEIT